MVNVEVRNDKGIKSFDPQLLDYSRVSLPVDFTATLGEITVNPNPLIP